MKQFFNEYGGVTIVLVVIAVLLLLVGTASVKADGTVEGNGVSGLVTNFMNETIGKLNINNPTLDGNGGETPEVAKTTSMMVGNAYYNNNDYQQHNDFSNKLKAVMNRDYAVNINKNIIFTNIQAPAGVETVDFTVNQDNSIVGWMEGDNVYISSQQKGTRILFPTYCSYLFFDMNPTSIDFANVDTSQTIDMRCMFGGSAVPAEFTSLDLSKFDISNVTNMQFMFYQCPNLTLDCSGWDVSNVTNYSEFNSGSPNIIQPNWN